MDEDSLTQEGLDASAIAVGGSFDQGPRRATIARESGWHEIYHELEQPMSEVEEADPLPPPKVVISRAASPPVQQSKPVRMKLSGLLYGNAELQEVDKAVAMRVTLEEINRMNEAEAKNAQNTTSSLAGQHHSAAGTRRHHGEARNNAASGTDARSRKKPHDGHGHGPNDAHDLLPISHR